MKQAKKEAPMHKAMPPQNGPNRFSDEQRSEDTERVMRGRPQKFGAAMEDEPDADAAGLAPGTEEQAPASAEERVTALEAENRELRSRLEAVEQHLGLDKKEEEGAAAPPEDESAEYGG